MTIAFVDTSYLLALLVRGDAHHGAALAWKARARSRLVTTEYVLVELVDALSAYRASGVAIRAVHALQGDAHATIVPASAEVARRGDGVAVEASRQEVELDRLHFLRRHGETRAHRGRDGGSPLRAGRFSGASSSRTARPGLGGGASSVRTSEGPISTCPRPSATARRSCTIPPHEAGRTYAIEPCACR